jgi:hypothetical protein
MENVSARSVIERMEQMLGASAGTPLAAAQDTSFTDA